MDIPQNIVDSVCTAEKEQCSAFLQRLDRLTKNPELDITMTQFPDGRSNMLIRDLRRNGRLPEGHDTPRELFLTMNNGRVSGADMAKLEQLEATLKKRKREDWKSNNQPRVISQGEHYHL